MFVYRDGIFIRLDYWYIYILKTTYRSTTENDISAGSLLLNDGIVCSL